MEINTKHIRDHLTYLTRRWDELPQQAQFEVRCISPSGIPTGKIFTPDKIDQAIEYAVRINTQGYNVYTTINPISMAVTTNASDADVIGSFYVCADCDDPTSMANVRQDIKDGFNETFAVHTGKLPPRGHIYYELEEPMTDMAAWREMQKAISNKFKSDEKIHNPSRIMRLAGTISYPDEKKKARGRVTELTELLKNKGDIKTIEALKKNFPTHSTPEKFEINFMGFSQTERVDIELAIARIRQNIDWHDNMIKVVASLVSRGRNDDEIHQALTGITQSGYTFEQTVREIDKAIEGARAKGFDNNINNNNLTQSTIPTSRSLISSWYHVDPLTLPRDEFLYSYIYVRKYCSSLIAPPGIGKSALAITEAISMATGQSLLGQHTVKCKVAYFNAEDPLYLIQSRVTAICQEYNIDQDELIDQFFMGSGRDTEIVLMENDAGNINQDAYDALEEIITALKLDVLILDPFANMHRATETNENFAKMVNQLSRLADRTNTAILIIHHTRKISMNQKTITDEDARGGSSLLGAVRTSRIINKMPEDVAEGLGIEDAYRYFRLDSGKNNLTLPTDQVTWFYKDSTIIPNGADMVVVRKYEPPSLFDGITIERIRQLHQEIDSTSILLMANIKSQRTDYKVSIHEFICDYFGFDFEDKFEKKRMSRIVNTWLKEDVLRTESVAMRDYDSKYKSRDIQQRIILGDTKFSGGGVVNC